MRSFNEAQIRTPEKFAACRRYIDENPVRKRLCSIAEEYPFSSGKNVSLDPAPEHLRG